MIQKQLICPERVRRVPKQFNWVDHRLVRDCFIEQCSHAALALYLFLVTVGDQQGLSYYSDRSLSTRLSMGSTVLVRARNELIRAKLIAYRKPFCHSRMMYLEFTVSQTMEHWLSCHQNALEFFQGAPKKIMVDNLKSAVIKRAVGQAVAIQKSYNMKKCINFEKLLYSEQLYVYYVRP